MSEDRDIVAMARAASYDDRLADGMLYRKLADEIERFQAIERHRDHLHDCLQRAERELDEARRALRDCHMLARRALAAATRDGMAKHLPHVLRICEAVDPDLAKCNILRGEGGAK